MEQIIKRKRGRPDKITPLKFTISKLLDKYPSWSDAEIRGELERILPELINTIPDIKDIEDLPGVFSIADYRRDEYTPRKREIELSGIDKEWHLHATPELPAEAISHIFELKKIMPKHIILPPSMSEPNPKDYVVVDGKKLTAIPKVFTIREAKWVARLYAVKSLRKPRTLMKAVIMYSLRQRLADLSGIPLDTSGLDEIIVNDERAVEVKLESFFEKQITQDEWIGLIRATANI